MVNLLKMELQCSHSASPLEEVSLKPDLEVYASFLMKGFVSLTDAGPKVPILRDIASSQSAILDGVLPLSVEFGALVHDFGMQRVGVLLYAISLDCDLVKGCVVLGRRLQFPIDGISLISGNNLAGGGVATQS